MVGPVGLEPTTLLNKSLSHAALARRFSHSQPFAAVRFELDIARVSSRARVSESPRFAIIRLIGCQMGVKSADEMFDGRPGLARPADAFPSVGGCGNPSCWSVIGSL